MLVVFLAGAAGAAYISGKMDCCPASGGTGRNSQSGTDPGDAVLSFDGMDLSGIDVMENGGSIAPPEGGVNINSGVINVLLIGSDERENSADGARADSIMMLSVDSRKNTWKLVSFERGVGVSIPNRGDDWLTHTYAYGGANLLMKTLQEYFKVDVSRYVKIDFSLFETAITDIGGVVVDMSQAEADYMNGIAGEQKWTAGTARLDGPTALVYARMRKLDSDWERVERQREVVQAAADQVATLSLPKLDLIANKLLPRIETNLTNGELWQLLFKMPVLLGKQAQQMTVPEREETWSISSGLQSSLIGCDFAAEADRLDRFLRGESSREGGPRVCGSPVCIKNECMENQNGSCFKAAPVLVFVPEASAAAMQLTHSVLDGRCHPLILFHAQMMHKKRMRARVAKITQRGSAGGTDLGVVVQQQGDEDVAGIVLSGPAQPGNGGKTDVFVAIMHELDQLILFPLLNTFFDFFQFPHTASTFLRYVPKADVFFPCIQ